MYVIDEIVFPDGHIEYTVYNGNVLISTGSAANKSALSALIISNGWVNPSSSASSMYLSGNEIQPIFIDTSVNDVTVRLPASYDGSINLIKTSQNNIMYVLAAWPINGIDTSIDPIARKTIGPLNTTTYNSSWLIT